MGHLLRGYKILEGNKISHRWFDSDEMPSDWFDSPEKCRAASGIPESPRPDPAIISPEPLRVQPPAGEPMKRPRGRPRKRAA